MPEPLSMDLIAEKVLDRAFPVDEEAATELQKKEEATKLATEVEEAAQKKKNLGVAILMAQSASRQKEQLAETVRKNTYLSPTREAPRYLKAETMPEPAPLSPIVKAAEELSDEDFAKLVSNTLKLQEKKTPWWKRGAFKPFGTAGEFVLGRPVGEMLKAFDWYFKKVTRPMAGGATWLYYKTIPGLQPGEEKYLEEFKQNRAEKGLWQGLGQSFEDLNLPWWSKLIIETAVDPLIWFPLTAYAKVPFLSARILKPSVAAYAKAMDYPFKLGAKTIKRIDAEVGRSIFGGVEHTGQAAARIAHKETTMSLNGATVLLSKTARYRGIEAVKPEETVRIYNNLIRAKELPIKAQLNSKISEAMGNIARAEITTQEDVLRLYKAAGAVPPEGLDIVEVVSKIDEIRFAHATGSAPIGELTSEGVLAGLHLAPTEKALGAMAGFLQRKQATIDNLLKSASKFPLKDANDMVGRAVGAKVGQRAADVQAAWRVQIQGSLGALMNRTEQVMVNSWNRTINRYLVAPFNEAYLGFAGYYIMNVPEELSRGIFGHGGTGRASVKEFSRATRGVEEFFSPDLYREIASSPAAKMLGTTTPEQRAGGISLVPKIGDPFFRTWIGKSNKYSSAKRRQYSMTRFNTHTRLELDKIGFGKVPNESKFLGAFNDTPKFSSAVEEMVKELQPKMYHAALSGYPEHIREFKVTLNVPQIQQKAAYNAWQGRVELPYSTRDNILYEIAHGDATSMEAVLSQSYKELPQLAFEHSDRVLENLQKISGELNKLTIKTPEEAINVLTQLNQVFALYPHMGSNVYKTAGRGAGMFPERGTEIWDAGHATVARFYEESAPLLDDMYRTFESKASKIKGLDMDSLHDVTNTFVDIIQDGAATREKISRESIDWFRHNPKAETPDWGVRYHAEVSGPAWDAFSLRVAEASGKWSGQMSNLARGQGLRTVGPREKMFNFTKTPPVVKDIAEILYGGSDDLSRAILESQLIPGREAFIKHVQGFAREQKLLNNKPAVVGLTDDAIGRIYDQVLGNIGMSDASKTLMAKWEHELHSLHQDMAAAYLSPKATQAEVEVLHKYIDRVADAAEGLKMPKVEAGRAITPESVRFNEIQEARKTAAKKSQEDLSHYFVDYGDPMFLDYIMKHIFPFWMYESRRWFFLPRLAAEYPGVFLFGTSRYGDYTDTGYFPFVAGMEMSIVRGTLLGASRRLIMPDYPELYEGGLYESLDSIGRWGFYPNVLVNTAVQTLGFMETGRHDYGQVLPAFHSTVLDAGIAAGVPGIQEIRDLFFHDRFRDYLTDQVLVKEYNVTMAELERALEDPATPESEKDKLKGWKDKAQKDAAMYNMIATQTGLVRLYPEERREYWERRAEAIQAMTGITIEQQDILKEKGIRPQDIVPLSPEQSRLLSFLEGSAWAGITSSLRPISLQVQMERQDKYYEDINTLLQNRFNGQAADDAALMAGTISPAAYYQNSSERWDRYNYSREALKEYAYSDVPTSWAETAEALIDKGIWVSPPHPVRQILDDYYSIKLPKHPDGTYDYETYNSLREQFLLRVPQQYLSQVVGEILKNRTPLEQKESWLQRIVPYAPMLEVGELYQDTLGVQRFKSAQETAKRYGIEGLLQKTPTQPLSSVIPSQTPAPSPTGLNLPSQEVVDKILSMGGPVTR